jgi:hypothetical protein
MRWSKPAPARPGYSRDEPISVAQVRIRHSAQVLGWLGTMALAIASWTPGEDMIRSGLSGQLEHALAYMLTGLALMIGYPSTPSTRIALGLSA